MDSTAPVNNLGQPVIFYDPDSVNALAWIRIANALERIATALEAKNKSFTFDPFSLPPTEVK